MYSALTLQFGYNAHIEAGTERPGRFIGAGRRGEPGHDIGDGVLDIHERRASLHVEQNAIPRIAEPPGVYALPDMVKAAALQKVATFDAFTDDNDPHGEHDFGSFELCGRKFFWKIEYYDRAMEYGSEDPSDPAKTTRVMTVMLASEY